MAGSSIWGERGVRVFKRMIEMLMLELWARELGAIEMLEWALENPEKSCWIAIGKSPVEGSVGDPPPQRVWRLN